MKDEGVIGDGGEISSVEVMLTDVTSLLLKSIEDTSSTSSLAEWNLMASSTLLGKIKEDTERCCGSILQAYFPEWPRNLVEHSGEMAMKGGDAILQWGQAVATYLSMDEYFQAISALHALQFQEEVEDMTEYPHLQAMVQRMTDREKFYAIQQSRGMGLYPSDEMKFMHSLVKQISTKCRRKEMEVMEREQKKANEQASISNLAIVNKTVELELQMRASTLDLMMADHYNRQERGLKEKMKVWTDTLSPSLNKCLLQHILRSASNVILALYATQSFTSSQDPIDQAEMKEHPERYHLRTNSAMGKFVESAEEYLVLITLWHLRSVASKLDHWTDQIPPFTQTVLRILRRL